MTGLFTEDYASTTNLSMTFSVIILLWCRLRRHSCLFCKLFDRLIQNHRHYASSYAIDGSSMYFRPCICLLLSHFHGHMEPSSLAPFSSWRLFLPFHSYVLTHFAPFWGCSARYIMRQVSLASRWLSEHPTLYWHRKIWWTGSCWISSGMFQIQLPKTLPGCW